MRSKLFLTFFVLLWSSLVSSKVKVCLDQELIASFLETKKSFESIEECAKSNIPLTLGFQEHEKTAFVFKEKIQDKIFYFSFPMIHEAKFFFFQAGKLVEEHEYSKIQNRGNEYVMIDGIGDHDNFIVGITNTRSSTQIPYLIFNKKSEFNNFLKSKLLFDGFWFGIMLLAGVISLTLFFFKRNKELLYFFIHICALCVIQSAFSGYFFSYLDFLPSWFKDRIVVFACSFLVLGTVGIIHHNFMKQSPESILLKIYRQVTKVAIVHFIFCVCVYNQWTIVFTSYLTLLLSLSTLVVCIVFAYLRVKNAQLFTLSFVLFLVSSLAFTLKDLGLFSINEINVNYVVKISLLVEIFILSTVFIRSLTEDQRKVRDAQVNKHISQNAQKLHHDIKSPLTTLEYLLQNSRERFDGAERVLLKESFSRVSDILNTLDKRNYMHNDDCILLSLLVPKIISDKRVEYQGITGISLTFNSSLSYGVFVELNGTGFFRTISNIINNSIEARSENKDICINVELGKINHSKVFVRIKDNGKGIKASKIQSIFGYGVSEGKKEGRGLGLSSAIEYIKSVGGDISVSSDFGIGTEVLITLPIAKSPVWFANEIVLNGDKQVCIVDDDDSVHKLWLRLLNLNDRMVTSLKNSDEFDLWIKDKKISDFTFFFDYELLGSEKTGLDLIEEYDLGKSSTLVTSYYGSKIIKEKAVELRFKLIPKEYLALVPITRKS